MASAQNGDTVKVHYTGKLENGTVFDSSEGREPLQFTIGQQQVILGFDQGVIGMEINQSKVIQIPAEKGYGSRRDDLILNAPLDQLPQDVDPKVGMQLQATQPDGQTVVLTILEINETEVKLDANHHLAGKDLTFDVQLVEIL